MFTACVTEQGYRINQIASLALQENKVTFVKMKSKITQSLVFQQAKTKSTPLRLFIKKCKYDWSFVFSGMLAFYLLTALLPMAITLFGILAFILDNRPDLQHYIRDKIVDAFPPKADEGLREIINMAFRQLHQDAKAIFWLGILFAILGSSKLFVATERCLAIIYRVQERKFMKKYILAIAMLFLFLILLLLMMITSAIPSIFLRLIPNSGPSSIVHVIESFLKLVFSFILFEIIYLIIPNKRMTLRQTWCGSVLAASALQLSTMVFPLYVNQYMSSCTGQVGFIIILLFFLYYVAVVLLLGAQINAFFFEHIQPIPVSLATFIGELTHREQHATYENRSVTLRDELQFRQLT